MSESVGGQLLPLVDLLYEGAVDPHAWPRFVERATAHLGAPKGRLFTPLTPPDKGGLGISAGIAEASLAQWAAKYIQHDIWVERAASKGLFAQGVVGRDNDIMPAKEFARSVIYREHLQHIGVGRLCFGVVFDESTPGAISTIFSVYRELNRPFEHEQVRHLRLLLPHLSRALGVMYRLRDAELKVVASRAALDALCLGVLLVGADGAVLHANPAAERILERGDGLRTRSARLQAQDPGCDRELQQALSRTLAREMLEIPHFSSAVLLAVNAGRRPLAVQLARLPDGNAFSGEARQACAVAFVTDPEANVNLDPQILLRIYGITPAESRLASAILEGNAADAALQCGVSKATVKTQLASLYLKTGAHHLSDLVRLLGSLASAQAR